MFLVRLVHKREQNENMEPFMYRPRLQLAFLKNETLFVMASTSYFENKNT